MTTYVTTYLHGTYEATPYADIVECIEEYLETSAMYGEVGEEEAEVYLHEAQGGYHVSGPVIRLDDCARYNRLGAYAQIDACVTTRTARRLVKENRAKYYESG